MIGTAPTSELRAELERALSDHFGTARRVAEVHRSPLPYQTSFAIEELDVALDDGTRLELTFKDLSEEALETEARKAKPAFLHDPLREIEAYRTLLGPAGLGTPVFYGAAVDPEQRRYWLFLEHVSGVPLWQIGELPTWERTATWLASMHERFAGDQGWQRKTEHLVRHDADFYRMWLQRAQVFAQATENAPPEASGRLEWLGGRYDKVVQQLVSLPVTFVHGEFYASNVLIGQDSGATRVCPIDWERAAVAPGLLDLAALAAGWGADERRALALAYRAALDSASGLPEDEVEFFVALDCCRLHMAVQWLGWAPDWSPPPEHRQDWLEEAMRAAEDLGL
jgi:hypothetical protein